MSRAEIADLLAGLDAIERCCEEGDWDAAAARLALHDRELRALTPEPADAEALRDLLARQQALEQLFRQLRDATADELGKLNAGRRGAAQYRG